MANNTENKAEQVIKFPIRLTLYAGAKICNHSMNDTLELADELLQEGDKAGFQEAMKVYEAFGKVKMILVKHLNKTF